MIGLKACAITTQLDPVYLSDTFLCLLQTLMGDLLVPRRCLSQGPHGLLEAQKGGGISAAMTGGGGNMSGRTTAPDSV